MSDRSLKSRWAASSVLMAVVLLCAAVDANSQPPEQGQSKKPAQSAAPDIARIRWEAQLGQLGRDANALQQASDRPYVLADIADAYWDFDRDRATALFTSAMDAALDHDGKAEDAERRASYVIASAARRDAALSKALTERLLSKEAQESRPGVDPVKAALDLLASDPQKAAQLVETGGPAGLSMDAAWFLFKLAERDPAVAGRLYRSYLGRLTPAHLQNLDQVMWLAGYAFGYGEAYGGAKDPMQLAGFGGLRIKGLAPNPALAAAFLDLASRSIQATLEQAVGASVADGDVLHSLALFATSYCLPAVTQYRPDALPEWYALHQRALSGTSPARREGVAQRLQSISATRAAAGSFKSPQDYAADQAQSAFDAAEKMPGGCQRDRLYAQAALGAVYLKDFERALEVSGRIGGDALAGSVRQYAYYAIADAAIEKGELDKGQEYADRVGAPEQRVLLYIKAARAALRQQNQGRATELLRAGRRLAERVSEADSAASVLVATAAVLAEFDRAEALQVMRDAVKAVNRVRGRNLDGFSVLRKVDLSCPGGDGSWYGGADQVERASLRDALSSLAKSDVEETLLIAESIEDPATRIRALVSIIKTVSRATNKPPARAAT
ncbi:MAG: hypothetical protein M3416_02470 [Acidobacteriota bacterium]|nr:hypothetical protein [Acidobacteriota bacterium]